MNLDTFAITVYQQPEVADACLTLQEVIGLDVPILLYCAWFGYRYGVMEDAQLSQVMEKSMIYANTVVKPMRRARRWMKDATQNQHGIRTIKNVQAWHVLREQIKAVEISAELLWLDALDTMTDQRSLTPQTDFCSQHLLINMQCYCKTLRTITELEALDVPLMLSTIASGCEAVKRLNNRR